MPLTCRVAGPAPPLPPAAPAAVTSARRASASSRSSFLRSSSNAARRAGKSAGPVFRTAAAATSDCASVRAIRSAAAPVTTSIRRTPAATALSETKRNKADIAGPPDMGAAAQFGRIIVAGFARSGRPHRHDAHLVAVFLTEQGERAGLDSGFRRHQPGQHRAVGADTAVDIVLRPRRSLPASTPWDG